MDFELTSEVKTSSIVILRHPKFIQSRRVLLRDKVSNDRGVRKVINELAENCCGGKSQSVSDLQVVLLAYLHEEFDSKSF